MSPDIAYIVHDDPANRPEQGYAAMVDLAPFGFAGMMEQLWLRPVGDGEYEVCCLPFRVYGLSLGDIVSLDEDGKHVVRLVRASGNRILRIFFPVSVVDSLFQSGRGQVLSVLAESGAVAEWSGDRHVAVHVPVGESAQFLWATVQNLGDIVRWEWAEVEEFRSGEHSV
ncbi:MULTISPECIES: DUF4265 domain-containing protein [unclassified Crossiella]|uniref:DUF4265 domain-containing protein n=1 Tax=unclassified Crossiella TaxID=2620835 RepID=UPI001FFFECE3|nr:MULTISPECIES: DUF4265 domain-containing protein [unclassified Crossiella]MCK2238496.1 DUF4265 domain-containing protein [Crossiella sp. S99.2]MCK2251934.1 DUF4265 domain-containing protein [Crossiella sp. S99.1]